MLLSEIKLLEEYSYPLLFEGKPVPSVEQLSKLVAGIFGPMVQAASAIADIENQAKEISAEFDRVDKSIVKKTKELALLKAHPHSGSAGLAGDLEDSLEELGSRRQKLKNTKAGLPGALSKSQNNFERVVAATKAAAVKLEKENSNFPNTTRVVSTAAGNLELPEITSNPEKLENNEDGSYGVALYNNEFAANFTLRLTETLAKAIVHDLSNLRKSSLKDIGNQIVRLGAHALGLTSTIAAFAAHWIVGIGAIWLWITTAVKLGNYRNADRDLSIESALKNFGFNDEQLHAAIARAKSLNKT